MVPKMLLPLLLLFVVASALGSDVDGAGRQPVSYRNFQLWSVKPATRYQRETLLKIQESYGLDLWNNARNGSAADLLVSPDFRTELEMRFTEEKIPFRVAIEDLETAIHQENPNADDDTEFENRFGHRMDWLSYHRFGDIDGYLKYLESTYPQTVKVINIGTSSGGRSLNVLRISSGTGSANKPAIWIDGGIHAREWISPAVVTFLIQKLVEFPENARMFQNVDWYIMPVMNPDGYEYTHRFDRMWRKTRSHNQRPLCVGTDANRNFGYKWGGKGTSQNMCSEIYAGRNAFSEPETRAVSNFILSKKQQLKMYLTFHSYGQYWLIPFGYDVMSYPSDYEDLKKLAVKAASKCKKYPYTVGNSADLLYPAAGGSDDWAKASAGIKYSYTIELPDRGNHGFILPSKYINPVAEDFFPAFEVLWDHVSSTYN